MGTALTIFHPPVNCLYTLETDIIILVIFLRVWLIHLTGGIRINAASLSLDYFRRSFRNRPDF